MKHTLLTLILALLTMATEAQPSKWTTIRNGQLWLTAEGDTVQAHAPGFLLWQGRWYMVGEDRAHEWNPDVNLYSSTDLQHWRFERKIIQNGVTDPRLGRRRMIERAKLMYNERTGRFVVWCHWESHDYGASEAACFEAEAIDGSYNLVWSGRPLDTKSRDCNVFTDRDGQAYFISTTNENQDLGLFTLADDYRSATHHTLLFPGQRREAPVIVHVGDYYFMLCSACSGWAPNQCKYAYSRDLHSGWSDLIDVGDRVAYRTQAAAVLEIKGSKQTTYLYVGDRWIDPTLAETKTIIFPITFEGTADSDGQTPRCEMHYCDQFEINFETGEWRESESNVGTHALVWQHGQQVRIACDTATMEPVVGEALRMFGEDYHRVLGGEVVAVSAAKATGSKADITLRVDTQQMKGQWEAFRIEVKHGRFHITGSDSHGLAYGLLEVSRLLGVSPWEWWADAAPRPREHFTLPDGYHDEQQPSVQFRGIFINDEDWGMLPWVTETYEPTGVKGRIGPKTHSRIFELLLRLRANTFWPAMHECSEPFFLTPGNRETAERYGIYIGTSHCEPMACNVNGEWRRRGQGDYDYTKNSTEVRRFWEERVSKTARQPVIYTLGMRGVHDGAMQGAKTIEEQKKVLERVLKDQRGLLEKHVHPDATQVPQVFIPYKEVLDIYNAGLQVPDDVCLMWCDDNYGYIRHFPTPEERLRKGGNGVYYHVSYWGRPHDYLWLGTLSPALLYQQLTTAYDRGIQKIWILNVGDIKPAEYQIELFMDMAWSMSSVQASGWTRHLAGFLSREFGHELGSRLMPAMQEHYRLAHIRKPEFMGDTRTEEGDRTYWNTIHDLPWSETYIEHRLSEYQHIEDEVELLFPQVDSIRQDTYFQLIKYPVQAAAEMNKKLLCAQKARHGLCDWALSDAAYDSIQALTRLYHTGIENRGKWHRMMDCHPRRLPVFAPVPHTRATTPMKAPPSCIAYWNGADCIGGDYTHCEGLGYEGKAVEIAKGKSIVFELQDCSADSIEVEVRLLPVHPIEGSAIRFQVTFDEQQSPVTNYATHGRSEEWKLNVLCNQARRRFRFPLVPGKKRHSLRLQALDDGIVLDQIVICPR